MSKTIGGSIGPFNEGQPIFDFLDDKVLNQLAKALQSYKGLIATAPLSIQRGPMGDAIGLQKRIDNFILCELTEDLEEDTSATAKVVRRDKDNDFIAADDSSLSPNNKTMEFEVWDSDIAVGGTTTKRFAGQRGIAFQNPFSKNGNWEFLSLQIQQGGTIINDSSNLTLVCPGDGANWNVFPFDTIFGSTPGSNFNLSSNQVTVTGDGPLKIAYKIYVDRLGEAQVENTDDSIEAKVTYDRGAGFVDIPCSYTIGLIDDVDIVCGETRKLRYEGTASCPMFYFNSQDGDIIRVEVRRKAGLETLVFPRANFPVDGEAKCSFMTFEQNR